METYQSCHTVSKKQFDAGVTYLSLMQENLQVLKTASIKAVFCIANFEMDGGFWKEHGNMIV